MLLRTHLAVGAAMALYFLPHINNRLIFFPAVLIASILPETGNILFKTRHKTGAPIKTRHPFGGITKTYTFCIIFALLLTITYPILAFPFFLGYSFNLILNAFTPEGITPFWPLKHKSTGHIAPGGTVEYTMFIVILLVDVALLAKLVI